MSNMLKKIITITIVGLVVLTAGCSGNTPSNNYTKTHTETGVNNTKVQNHSDKNTQNKDKTNEVNYTTQFKSKLNDSPILVESITLRGEKIVVRYTGNFSNKSRTTSEITYITTRFANIVGNSYENKSKWGVKRLNIVGVGKNGSTIWDSRTEDWWAMKYVKSHWDIASYISATVSAGEYWNTSANEPYRYGDKYISEFRTRLQRQTDIDTLSLNKHGAEAFLTYETDRTPNTTEYVSQLVNVTNTYGNLTLPRSLNRTDGWYPGVLNIEVRHGNDTIEWFRYRIRWAESVVQGRMERGTELELLGASGLHEKDRLRDEPDPDE